MAVLKNENVERAVAALGRELLEFVCACPLEEMSVPGGFAAGLISEINGVLETKVEGSSNPAAMSQFLRYRMGEIVDGEVLALTLHKRAGGVLESPTIDNELDGLLVRLAMDCYPLILLPPDDFMLNLPGRLNSQVTSALFRHDLAQEFHSKILADPQLGPVFTEHSSTTGYSTSMIYRSTGHGSSLQLWSLLDVIMGGAWRSRPNAPHVPTVSEFCSLVIDRWHLIRDALMKKRQLRVSARYAFTGVHLPAPGPYNFGSIELRRVDARDQEYVPEQLIGKLTGTDASGNSVVIDYAGDIVAEMQFPYVLRFVEQAADEFPAFPTDITNVNNAEELSRRLRISLLLAAGREHRVHIVPSWQSVDDPLEHVAGQGWADPRQAVGLMPTQLTEEEVANWQRWYEMLERPGSERLTIAVSRILKAVAERRDPVDVLIDSVIAWENLFGSSQGEPTLRVTASMALLLEEDAEKRFELREKLGKIYALRSKAVHGSSQPKPAEMALCFEALDYAIRAMKVVFSERPDLLDHADGTGRSMKLILG